jgi:hypothetical protein
MPRTSESLRARWELFWFEPVPVEIFAVLRIVFGILGLVSLAGQLPTSTFWRPDGIVPIPSPGGFRETVINMGLGVPVGEFLFWGFAAALLAMTVGLGSRLVVPLAFAFANVQFLWGRLQLSGANAVFVVMLFCLVWAETGATLSIDAWLERRRTRRPPNAAPKLATVLPLRMIQLQLAVIYFNSGLFKIHDASWRDGTALHWAMTNNVFHRFPFALPLVNDATLTAATYTTVFWEIGFPFLLLNRFTRRIALVVGVILHLGIWTMMEVGPFSPIMLAAYIAFLNPQHVTQWVSRMNSSRVTPAAV